MHCTELDIMSTLDAIYHHRQISLTWVIHDQKSIDPVKLTALFLARNFPVNHFLFVKTLQDVTDTEDEHPDCVILVTNEPHALPTIISRTNHIDKCIVVAL